MASEDVRDYFDITPAQWATLRWLLEAALALPAPARDAWVDQAALRFPELAQRLRSLLAVADSPAAHWGERLPTVSFDTYAPRAGGSRVDRYGLIRELGRGGMATVWLAERIDDAGRAQVALKLPNGGWRAAGLRERMERERAILARLEHPRIARLLDSGVTDDGQPWLALELIDGQPIDRYCAQHALDARDRLRLFLQAVQAAAFAHACQVVHRDLKPANIFVDTRGEVHLLDFGIAKLLEPGAGTDGATTRVDGHRLTPEYASPEQARGAPVGAASDVYSLGVVLHELLTGERPRRALERNAATAPPGDTAAVAPLREPLAAALEAIVGKALQVSPFERYRSADAFADDIERYLQGRPALAQREDRRPGDPQGGERAHASRKRLSLPVAPALVGRAADCAVVADLLHEHRLVTVAGAGGVGKTALARVVAHDVRARMDAAAWWVDLSTATSLAQLAAAIAAVVRVDLAPGDAVTHLAAALAGEEGLLVLDNCEHLGGSAAQVAAALLAAAPGLRLLATSREPLHVPDERVHRLGTLKVPPPGATLADARACSAFQLLEQRIGEIDATARLDAHTAAAAIAICRTLDGVALAIEMAAARVPALGFDAVLALLDASQASLATPSALAPPRQRTLQATLDWSYGLLDGGAQAALRALSVFAGPFGLDTALRVIGGDAPASPAVLTALVDKSLVHAEAAASRRYRLLGTVRRYAAERLAAAGDLAAVMVRHGAAMAGVAGEVHAALLRGAPDTELVACFEFTYADMEKAFDAACDRNDAATAGATLAALRSLDAYRSAITEMEHRVARVLPLAASAAPAAAALIHTTIARCGWLEGLAITPIEASRRAVIGWRQAGADPTCLLQATMLLAINAAVAGNDDEARAALAELRRLAADTPHAGLRRGAAVHAGHVVALVENPQRGLEMLRQVLPDLLAAGAGHVAGYVRMHMLGLTSGAGDHEETIALAQAALPALRALGQRQYLAIASLFTLRAFMALGDHDGAARMAREMLALAWDFDQMPEVAHHAAHLAASAGQFADAVRFAAYADACYAARGVEQTAAEARASAASRGRVREILDAGAITRLSSEGARWSQDEAHKQVTEFLGAWAGMRRSERP